MDLEPDWDHVLPAEPYRFRMGLRPGDAARFFAPTGDHDRLVAERTHWIREAAAEHCLLEPEGYPLLDETIELAAAWGTAAGNPPEREARCRHLGSIWEPDFLLLGAGPDGVFRLAWISTDRH